VEFILIKINNMSRHNIERTQKNCLNCNAEVSGRFCQVCGQENVEINETFGSLLKHFVFDLFHFDGKFWLSLKYLIFKPGFLAKEYMRGKRISYFHPIRMYIFVSTVFFLLFFGFYSDTNEVLKLNENDNKIVSLKQKLAQLEKKQKKIVSRINDSTFQFQKLALIKDSITIANDISLLKKDSSNLLTNLASDSIRLDNFAINNKPIMSYNNFNQYDSFQNTLAKKDRDNFFKKYLTKKFIGYNEAKQKGRGEEYLNQLKDNFLHSIPKVLFILMPFFAFVLLIAYARNKKLLYMHHSIFTLYYFSGFFIINLLNLWLGSINKLITGSNESNLLSTIFSVGYMAYVYFSFKNFYQQSILKTIIKILGVLVLLIVLTILLLIFLAILLELIM
jgi:hypothetical protein